LSTANILTLVGILLTFASVTFAARQLQRSRRTNQAQFLFNITTWFLNDSDLRDIFYKLDYNMWEFDEKTFPGSEDEPKIDKMLFVFDLLEHLIESEHISVDDLRILAFEASRVLHNPEVKRYLNWLDSEYRLVGRPTPAYARARKLAERLLATGLTGGTATTLPATVTIMTFTN
jgi:hypothetical protein